MPVTDEDAALAAVATLQPLSPEQDDALKSINAILNNGEPFVDIHELFALYNILYFRKLLLPRVEVIWSPRLTLVGFLCASQFAFHASHPPLLKPPSCLRTVAPPASRLPCQTPANNRSSALASVSYPGIPRLTSSRASG